MRYNISVYHIYYGAALSFKTSTHYTTRGGFPLDGSKCGAFYIGINGSASINSWVFGAALE